MAMTAPASTITTTATAAAVATNATHDTETTAEWFDSLSEEDRKALQKLPGFEWLDPKQKFDDRVRDGFLRLVYGAPSTLALVLFQDAMGSRERINRPGTTDPANWSYRAGKTIDELNADRDNTERLARLSLEAGRVAR